MYLGVYNTNTTVEILYPLVANEVFLPECTTVDVWSVVCLRLNSTATNPQLVLTGGAESTDILWTNTEFSARAVFGGAVPAAGFSCSSAEGHVTSAVVTNGEISITSVQ